MLKTVEDYPAGFPRLAAFLNSDDDFAILRRFGKLHMRMLVQLQVELTLLEEELEKMDRSDDGSEFEYRLRSMEHKETWNQSRKELESKILLKLHEYGKSSAFPKSSVPNTIFRRYCTNSCEHSGLPMCPHPTKLIAIST
jgi:hypothetical protein